MQDPVVPSTRQRSFDASPSAVGATRTWVRDALLALGADERTVRDMTLVASELASNLVQHGPAGNLSVTVADPPGWWELCIAGSSVPAAPVAEWVVADGDRFAGRGLGIVRSLMDEVDVDGATNTVRCRLRRDDPG